MATYLEVLERNKREAEEREKAKERARQIEEEIKKEQAEMWIANYVEYAKGFGHRKSGPSTDLFFEKLFSRKPLVIKDEKGRITKEVSGYSELALIKCGGKKYTQLADVILKDKVKRDHFLASTFNVGEKISLDTFCPENIAVWNKKEEEKKKKKEEKEKASSGQKTDSNAASSNADKNNASETKKDEKKSKYEKPRSDRGKRFSKKAIAVRIFFTDNPLYENMSAQEVAEKVIEGLKGEIAEPTLLLNGASLTLIWVFAQGGIPDTKANRKAMRIARSMEQTFANRICSYLKCAVVTSAQEGDLVNVPDGWEHLKYTKTGKECDIKKLVECVLWKNKFYDPYKLAEVYWDKKKEKPLFDSAQEDPAKQNAGEEKKVNRKTVANKDCPFVEGSHVPPKSELKKDEKGNIIPYVKPAPPERESDRSYCTKIVGTPKPVAGKDDFFKKRTVDYIKLARKGRITSRSPESDDLFWFYCADLSHVKNPQSKEYTEDVTAFSNLLFGYTDAGKIIKNVLRLAETQYSYASKTILKALHISDKQAKNWGLFMHRDRKTLIREMMIAQERTNWQRHKNRMDLLRPLFEKEMTTAEIYEEIDRKYGKRTIQRSRNEWKDDPDGSKALKAHLEKEEKRREQEREIGEQHHEILPEWRGGDQEKQYAEMKKRRSPEEIKRALDAEAREAMEYQQFMKEEQEKRNLEYKRAHAAGTGFDFAGETLATRNTLTRIKIGKEMLEHLSEDVKNANSYISYFNTLGQDHLIKEQVPEARRYYQKLWDARKAVQDIYHWSSEEYANYINEIDPPLGFLKDLLERSQAA